MNFIKNYANFRNFDYFLKILNEKNEIRKKEKNVNSAGPIPAHRLGLPGPAACGTWQTIRPSGADLDSRPKWQMGRV
jgi:hypothetical protein